MISEIISSIKREFARRLLDLVFSAHFIRRRALSRLNRHFDKGELKLVYRMKDHVLQLDPADDVITPRVLLRGNWQRDDLERALSVLKSQLPPSHGRTFVDAGANIGTETIYALLSGMFESAVAIEPDPDNYAMLVENIAANGLKHRVHAEMVAVGDKVETRMLVRSQWNKGGHAFAGAQVKEAGIGLPVSVVTLPDVLERAGIKSSDVGLLWMDVNGAEGAVLRGMGDMLAMRIPVVLEHLPELVDAAAAREVIDLLRRHYRHFLPIEVPGALTRPIAEFDPLGMTGDFLFF
jgi:FkbM family methyltransferase